MGNDLFAKLAEKYPFITLCVYASAEYVGIVQNQDDAITTIYDFGSIQDIEQKKLFLELANVWWWGWALRLFTPTYRPLTRWPPSTAMVAPVMALLASEANNNKGPFKSSKSLKRREGIRVRIF